MRVMPIVSSNPAQANKQQNFKSQFVANKVLKDAFNQAEKTGCRFFMTSVKNLLNDGLKRTIELTGSVLVSKDGIVYTKTKLKVNEDEKEVAGFPHIYDTSCEEMIANDARLLIIDMNKLNNYPNYNEMDKETVRNEIRKLEKQIFKKQ